MHYPLNSYLLPTDLDLEFLFSLSDARYQILKSACLADLQEGGPCGHPIAADPGDLRSLL